ncbi:phosphoribosylaminoimidazolesuccinocarboxamide synthase [Hymenobacter armeniacus]|uniref:Phosphoribosylaminoimidazole-succinocarboxamide synthase n=1 Tax=Hymenobacter armeniacus TaxID=2771358 RepID=A0ABR8JZL7_9BACT|nr:phosphoribosylaminoimidazolesuccinocarboxamide synthase [Hymenobacter armeniacus]MBD2724366.1 AIR carboxylase family protein [Hymenobacter armeniacus]
MNTLTHFATPQLPLLHRGKVRDSLRAPSGDRLIIVTDRLSAFDSVLETAIPHKGAVLNGLANFWFEKTAHIIPNHVIKLVDANAMLVKEAAPIKVEMVVRQYLTGSMWRGYQAGQRTFSGVTVPDGMTKHQPFPQAIVTPTTKEESDREITPDNLVSEGWVTKELYDQMAVKAQMLFAVGSQLLAEKGIILVDTKYEFGLLNGKLILIDEMHTPDSSRFWAAEDYAKNPETAEQMDKEYVRQWLIANKKDGQYPRALTPEVAQEASRRYLDIYQRITGEALPTADTHGPDAPHTGRQDARARMLANLVQAGLMKDAWVNIVMDSPADKEHCEQLRRQFDGYDVFTQLRVASALNFGEALAGMAEIWNNSLEPGVVLAVAGLGGALAATVNVPVISCPPYQDYAELALSLSSLALVPSGTPSLTAVRPDNAAQAALRALNLPRLRERLRQELNATKARLKAADEELRAL